MAARVADEKVLYLLDPTGASRRSAALRLADRAIARPAPGAPQRRGTALYARRSCAKMTDCSSPSASSINGWAASS